MDGWTPPLRVAYSTINRFVMKDLRSDLRRIDLDTVFEDQPWPADGINFNGELINISQNRSGPVLFDKVIQDI